MIYRSRIVVTMDGPPISNGAIAVSDGTVQAVGDFDHVQKLYSGRVVDLGEQALLPGLINAHCHLDYTMMRNAIHPQKSFTQWIARINALKRSLDVDDYVRAIEQGFAELKKWGTTTVLNIEAFPEVLPKLPAPPIRTWWFYELIDVRQRVATDDLVAGAFMFFKNRPDWLGGFGLSPHSPYTASAELFGLANACARITGMPLTTHVAESAAEDEMFRHGSGELHDFMQKLGRSMDDCGQRSSLARLWEEKLVDEDWILAHVNEIDDADFALIVDHLHHIVHCPRSHRYFAHRPFQFRRLHEAGANLSLGTDSVASNDSLSLFAEMQALQERETWLRSEDLLRTVTTNPARALKRSGELGQISPGAHADLICVPFGGDAARVYEATVNHTRPIEWLMVDGNVAG
ncbi:MAG: aminodeoxyfutalosine deaminase [Chthoniobacter sp.]|jgi:cytosine/adenosine deaminase-related metal-dependent hydrolase|nr:aminodeoxyfutalosine deaminase [Chthoniobacter sp.]